jgi:hypothetical protein
MGVTQLCAWPQAVDASVGDAAGAKMFSGPVHALRGPYPRAERAARADGDREAPGSPLRT